MYYVDVDINGCIFINTLSTIIPNPVLFPEICSGNIWERVRKQEKLCKRF